MPCPKFIIYQIVFQFLIIYSISIIAEDNYRKKYNALKISNINFVVQCPQFTEELMVYNDSNYSWPLDPNMKIRYNTKCTLQVSLFYL